MKNRNWMSLAAGALLALTLAACSAAPAEPTAPPAAAEQPVVQETITAGSDTQPAATPEPTAVGSMLLSVNPEVRMHYDADGLVVRLEGCNDDGRAVVDAMGEVQGLPCADVADDLTGRLLDDGYLTASSSVVLKLEPGSADPGSRLMEDVAQEIRDAAQRHGTETRAVAVAPDQMDDTGRITAQAAQTLALEQLGIAAADFAPRPQDADDDVYELEFTADGVRYAYELDANTGRVRVPDYTGNADWQRDDWDDRYDDDWDDQYDDDWDDRYDDDWDDQYDDDWDDQYDDDWDDQYDDWDDQYDDDWDDQYDDDWDDQYDDDWDDQYDDDWDDQYDDDWDDQDDDDWDDDWDD